MAHTFYDKAPTQELLEAYKKNNSFLIPTLCASATLIGEESESSEKHVGHQLAEKVLDETGKTCFCGRMKIAKEGCKAEFAYETVKMVKRHGLDIIWSVSFTLLLIPTTPPPINQKLADLVPFSGTDTSPGFVGTAFGLSVHQELSLLTTRCDLTPGEALRSATATTARRFGLKDRGRLAKGLRADVLMVRGDPTVDIRCTMDIASIWRGGVALKG
jgi:hypothetical protein